MSVIRVAPVRLRRHIYVLCGIAVSLYRMFSGTFVVLSILTANFTTEKSKIPKSKYPKIDIGFNYPEFISDFIKGT